MEIILDIETTRNENILELFYFDRIFGLLLTSTLRIYQDDLLIDESNYNRFSEGTYSFVRFPLRIPVAANEQTSIRMTFKVDALICSPVPGTVAVQGTWATFERYRFALIEYDIMIQRNKSLHENLDIEYVPFTNTRTLVDTESEIGYYLAYPRGYINQGRDPLYPTTRVFFNFDSVHFSKFLLFSLNFV